MRLSAGVSRRAAGMLVVKTIGRIRREHLVKGKSIKEIARDLKSSRNTVRKVLRSGDTSFWLRAGVQPRPKLGRWRGDLERLLAANAAKASRERLTLIRIFEELRALGCEGAYDAVRRMPGSGRRDMPRPARKPTCRSPLRPEKPTSSTGVTRRPDRRRDVDG